MYQNVQLFLNQFYKKVTASRRCKKRYKEYWVQPPYRMEEQGDVFAVLHYDACDDYFYGYMESLYSVHPSFEEAKESVDSFLEENKNEFQPYDGVDWESFITIVQMKWGVSKRNELYNTTDFERKAQRIKEEKEERKKELKERQKKKKEEEEMFSNKQK